LKCYFEVAKIAISYIAKYHNTEGLVHAEYIKFLKTILNCMEKNLIPDPTYYF